MLLRLILVLVLALAAPVMPAGACDMRPMTMAGQAMPHHDRKAPMPVEHVCIGCVAVADWETVRIAPRIMLPAPLPLARIAALPLLPGEAPTPPPPRRA